MTPFVSQRIRFSGLKPMALEQLETGYSGGARSVADQLGGRDLAPGQVERIEQAGGGDDGSTVLVIVEDGDVHQFAQALLDHETFRRLDVFEIDPAPALAEKFDAIDDLVGILGGHFEIDGVDIGKALEQDGLAFHDRLCGKRAAVAEPEDRGSVGDDGYEIALGRVVVGAGFVLGDCEDRDGDPRRIGQ